MPWPQCFRGNTFQPSEPPPYSASGGGEKAAEEAAGGSEARSGDNVDGNDRDGK